MLIGEASRQIDYTKPVPEAWAEFRTALDKIGTVTMAEEHPWRVQGHTKFGRQKVLIKVSLESMSNGSRITLGALSDDVWASGAKDALNRLLEAFEYRDNPEYKPSKVGWPQVSLGTTILLFLLLILGRIIRWWANEVVFWIALPLVPCGAFILAYMLWARRSFLLDDSR